MAKVAKIFGDIVDDELPSKKDIKHAEHYKPEHLTPAQAKIWDRVAPVLWMLGRGGIQYVDSISEYCIIYERLISTRAYLDANGWSYESDGRYGEQEKFRPEVGLLNDDHRKWRTLVNELGLGPSSEKAISNKAKRNKSSGWDSF